MSTSQRARPPVVVVGTQFGARTHVPALRAAGFDVVGLVGTNAERTAKQAQTAGIAHSFTDLDTAITQTKPVAVTIATPPHTHAPLTLNAIARGCHVLCEKPFAKDTAEAQTMLAAAQRAGIGHFVGTEFRCLPEWATIARVIADGTIGQPRFVTIVQYMPLVANPDARMPHWWFDTGAGGGWLGAHGAHIIDQVRMWLGDFASISASLPIVSARSGNIAEDSYSLRFKLVNGVGGIVQQTAGAWGPPAGMTRVAGTDGTLWLDGSAVKLADRNGTHDVAIPDDLRLPPFPGADPAKPPPDSLTTFTRLCEALLARVEGREPSKALPWPTFADGVACMKVLDAIRASAARDGALVTL